MDWNFRFLNKIGRKRGFITSSIVVAANEEHDKIIDAIRNKHDLDVLIADDEAYKATGDFGSSVKKITITPHSHMSTSVDGYTINPDGTVTSRPGGPIPGVGFYRAYHDGQWKNFSLDANKNDFQVIRGVLDPRPTEVEPPEDTEVQVIDGLTARPRVRRGGEQPKPVVNTPDEVVTLPEGPATTTVTSVPRFTPPLTGFLGRVHARIQKAIDDNHELDIIYKKSDSDAETRTIAPTSMRPAGNNTIRVRAFDFTPSKQSVWKDWVTERIVGFNEPSRPLRSPLPVDTEAPRAKANQPVEIVDNQPQVVKTPSKLYKSREKTGTIDPTPEEYEELRSLDIDPDTHDKATIRRIRNLGISHLNLKSVAEMGIPYEDYEDALSNNNNNHELAVQDAQKYMQKDIETMSANQRDRLDNPSRNSDKVLSPQDYQQIATGLFLHHLSLRNMPQAMFTEDKYPPIEGRRRGNEWLLSEITKLEPALRGKETNPFFDERTLLDGNTVPRIDGTRNVNYYDQIHALTAHHRTLGASATNFGDFVKHRRSLGSLARLSRSRFSPVGYTPDVYEEAY